MSDRSTEAKGAEGRQYKGKALPSLRWREESGDAKTVKFCGMTSTTLSRAAQAREVDGIGRAAGDGVKPRQGGESGDLGSVKGRVASTNKFPARWTEARPHVPDLVHAACNENTDFRNALE